MKAVAEARRAGAALQKQRKTRSSWIWKPSADELDALAGTTLLVPASPTRTHRLDAFD